MLEMERKIIHEVLLKMFFSHKNIKYDTTRPLMPFTNLNSDFNLLLLYLIDPLNLIAQLAI